MISSIIGFVREDRAVSYYSSVKPAVYLFYQGDGLWNVLPAFCCLYHHCRRSTGSAVFPAKLMNLWIFSRKPDRASGRCCRLDRPVLEIRLISRCLPSPATRTLLILKRSCRKGFLHMKSAEGFSSARMKSAWITARCMKTEREIYGGERVLAARLRPLYGR